MLDVFKTTSTVRSRWRIRGRVQGVGFRPFVYRLANQLNLTGAVWNDPDGVIIEAQGPAAQLAAFVHKLCTQAPAASRVRQIIEEPASVRADEHDFQIRKSTQAASATAEVTADLAICQDCAAEIRDPANRRRYRYALTNCTNCGPRFSIVRAVPYDRPNTTMAAFSLCEPCHAEYDDPKDRRFHAQPTACRVCGPRVDFVDQAGKPIPGDAIESAAKWLNDGKIVAVKGIGGFHLAVRADVAAAVQRLRDLKQRPAKPFALMCGSIESARRLIKLSPRGEQLITSKAAPIVLAKRLPEAHVAVAVAPNSHRLGVMLAYTPLHCLLFDELHKLGVAALVMTSGNDIDEPLVFEDFEAVRRLGGLCDAILLHNRPIQRAVDDSVVIDADSTPIFVRRSRGFVPEPIVLPSVKDVSPGLAVGAELKNTVATYREGKVVLSQHLGNLTQARTFESFKCSISDLCRLGTIEPKWIAHDLHPAYLSTQHAQRLAGEWNVPLIGVQHHHAHAAAVLAEHGWTEPALAVVCDGTGFGTDGTIWGGELLLAGLDNFQRLGRLRPIMLPGGDVSAKHPWRSALALLFAAWGSPIHRLPICKVLAEQADIEFVRQMLMTGISCVQSSSTGRVFDGIAAILGLCLENRFDAEAPAALEAAAVNDDGKTAIPENIFELSATGGLVEIDLAPLVRKIAHAVMNGGSVMHLAMLFHVNLAAAWAAAVNRAIHLTGIRTVALGGGVFCNELLTQLLAQRLERLGARVLRPIAIPPNDGGIAYGQAAVAAARVQRGLLN